MRFGLSMVRMFTILTCLSSCLVATLQAEIILTNVQMVAVQRVNLLGIHASLVASGPATFAFDVDANMNTIPGGASTIDTLFSGFLPVEFTPLGVNGAPFQLFSIDPEVLTATNNGTHVRVDTTFGLRVFAGPGVVGADFFTKIPSIFETTVTSLQDLNGSVFQASNRPNDITEIFIGNSILPGLPQAGSLVGISFDRTVTVVPEPTSLLLCALIGFACVPFAHRRRATRERVQDHQELKDTSFMTSNAPDWLFNRLGSSTARTRRLDVGLEPLSRAMEIELDLVIRQIVERRL